VHELSVCQALLIQVAAIAEAQGAVGIERITIEVGPLCGTEPALLLNAFRAMRSGAASTSELRIERCPVSISCLECGAQSETRPNRLICTQCGGWRTRVVAGDGLRLLRVEMRMPDSPYVQSPPSAREQMGYV
jgi:hydrogenase nickel incorporation protein HypA/HybF